MLIVDARYGNILQMPFEGGAFEQPYKTVEVIQTIQGLYREHLSKETKKAQMKSQRRR